MVEISAEQFQAAKSRLTRILRGCGWTLNLRRKPSGYYAYAVRRDKDVLRDQYIAPAHKIEWMLTDEIRAVLRCKDK